MQGILNQPTIEQQLAMNQQADINRRHNQLADSIKRLENKMDTILILLEKANKPTRAKSSDE